MSLSEHRSSCGGRRVLTDRVTHALVISGVLFGPTPIAVCLWSEKQEPVPRLGECQAGALIEFLPLP